MLLCLHWSGAVCIIFWTEWCHCQSVVMVTHAFIVCSHRSEGCRKITHPPDCCSGPLNPPAPHHKPSFFPIFWDQLDSGGFTRRERAAGICHSPPHGCLYGWCSSPQSSQPPVASTSCFLLQGMMGAGPPPPPPPSVGVKLERRAEEGREGPMGLDDGCHSDWTGAGDSSKSVNANAFGGIITSFY